MEYSIKANGKINLGINVIKKNDLGYHILDMIMVPIDLSDQMKVNILGKVGDLTIRTNKKDIPTDGRNILTKVYNKFYERSSLDKMEISLDLTKKIPHEAGLGGGSSDGGRFLRFLNEYHNKYFTDKELKNIGLEIGADVPFFIDNRPYRVTGIGEIFTDIKNALDTKIVIIKPNFGVSTKIAYENVDKLLDKKDANIDNIIKGLECNDLSLVQDSIENQLEQGLLLTDDKIKIFRSKLDKIEKYKFFMSGSGSAYFAFVPSDTKEEDLLSLRNKLNNCEVHLCNFL